MKKEFIFGLTILLLLPFMSSMNLQIEEQTSDVAMIKGLDMPAIFDLNIKNQGSGDYFMFYNYFGSDMFPKGTVAIAGGETKDVRVGIYPRSDLAQEGRMKFDIYIKGQNGDQIAYPLMVNVVQLKDAFEVGAEEFNPESNNISVYVRNRINFNFEDITVVFKSSFFTFEKKCSLDAYQKQVFEVVLDKEDFRELMTGYYTLNADVTAKEKNVDVEGVMKYSEKDIVTSSQDEYGIIIHTKKISKVNEGNIVSDSSTTLKKNIISRLFTTFSPEPEIVERKGVSVYYTWERELSPGERLDIIVKTNWLLPLLAVLLIVAIVILTKQFSKTNLSLKKKVTFVKAKGGEFALKVSLIISARKYIEKVHVVDRLPLMAKLHEKFLGELPKRVDLRSKRIEWHFDKMQPGESRMVSYIIYSKVGILGKFALPLATAVYEKDGDIHEAESNHAFFIADQARKSSED